jgi:hypothetical protein
MAKKKKTAPKKTRKQGKGHKKLSPDLKGRKKRDSGVLGKGQ